MTRNSSRALNNAIRLVGSGLLVLPGAAFAHPGHEAAGGGGVQGLMHPFTGLDHALAMILVGLFAYRLGGRALWMLPLAFLAAMAAGGILGFAAPATTLVEVAIALSVILLGIAVAFNIKAPVAVAAGVVGLFAIFHGFAHGAEMPAGAGALPYAGGFLLGTATLLAIGLGAGTALTNTVVARGGHAMRSAGTIAAVVGVGLLSGISG